MDGKGRHEFVFLQEDVVIVIKSLKYKETL